MRIELIWAGVLMVALAAVGGWLVAHFRRLRTTRFEAPSQWGVATHRVSSFVARIALALPRGAKRATALGVDVVLCVLAAWGAICLAHSEYIALASIPPSLPVVSVALALPVFILAGMYRSIFRYVGLPAMVTVGQATLVYGVLFATSFTVVGFDEIPKSVGLIQPLLLLVLVGISRAMARIWLSHDGAFRRSTEVPSVLLYGAGLAGRQLAAAMVSSKVMRVVGFLDDDTRLHGQEINGLPIYNPAHLASTLAKVPVTEVLLTLPSASRQRRNAILNSLAAHRLAVRTLPGVCELATGRITLGDIRYPDIHDLLGRVPVQPNDALLARNTAKKVVLVTGAGGSIGSELCRQVLKSRPRQLLLVEMSEFALYQIHQELQAALSTLSQQDGVSHQTEIVPLLASVCDEVRMQEIMETWRPHTVYHAAAYKHVPLVEHNPAEGVRNNVWGTKVCAEAAARNGVHNFVLVSTDKAVRPTNVMGATKRLAEMVLQALAEATATIDADGSVTFRRTCFSMVRFGNVLGSSGSVVPLFREQIKNGGPVTLTHREMTRYFMTIPEAAQLVIQAGAMGTGGDVFVLDMGEPVRIYDLALRMIELSGLTLKDELCPDGDIEVTVSGLRPGEKLYEELLIGDNPKPTQHSHIMKAHEEFLPWGKLSDALDALSIANNANDVPLIRGILQQLVQGYQPSGDVVDWVHMAIAREGARNVFPGSDLAAALAKLSQQGSAVRLDSQLEEI